MVIPSVVSVEQTGPYRLRLRFDDGADGEIDIRSTTTFEGVFEPLNDPAYFSQVRISIRLFSIRRSPGSRLRWTRRNG
jgi:hypothetical protein